MPHIRTFLVLATAAIACGKPPVVEPPPKPVLVYVCVKDGTRTTVEDPSSCPPNTTVIETVVKYACPGGNVVDDQAACGRLCPEGYAYEETAEQCLKVCPAGQAVNAAGDGCVATQVRGTVYVRQPNDGIPQLVEATVGTRTDLFPLVIQDIGRAVTLVDVRFLAYVGVEQDGVVPDPSLWLHTQADVANYVGDCTLYDQVTAQSAGPVAVDHVPLSEQAMVFFPEAVGSGFTVNVSVRCDLKPAPIAYHVALVLDLINLVDADTGEPIVGSEVTFDGLNSGFDYQVRAAPLPACPPPVLTINSSDPGPAADPAFPEVLRFDVVADPSCRALQTWSVQYAVFDNGWYATPSTIRVTDVRDPSRSLFTFVQTTVNAGDFLFLVHDPPNAAVTIPTDRPLTLRLQMDTSQSSASGTDTLRVDVVGFCYRDPAAALEACLDRTSVLVAGSTLVF